MLSSVQWALSVTPGVVLSRLNLASLLWRHRSVAGSLLLLQQLGYPALLDAAGNRFAAVDVEWAVALHRLDDGFLGLLPASELQPLEDVRIYGRLDNRGSEDAIVAGEATAGWLVGRASGLPSDRGGKVIEAVASR